MSIYDGDVRITQTAEGGAITYTAGQPAMDQGLETAVYISLFTRRGWWGNDPGDDIGSDLEEILRSSLLTDKLLPSIVAEAKRALAWIVATGAASSVDATAEILDSGILALSVYITEPGKATSATRRYLINWAAESRSLEVA